MEKPQTIRDDIEFFEDALKVAEKYSNDIFDVVSSVKRVGMLDHNRDYINAIKAKIERLKEELKESESYYGD